MIKRLDRSVATVMLATMTLAACSSAGGTQLLPTNSKPLPSDSTATLREAVIEAGALVKNDFADTDFTALPIANTIQADGTLAASASVPPKSLGPFSPSGPWKALGVDHWFVTLLDTSSLPKASKKADGITRFQITGVQGADVSAPPVGSAASKVVLSAQILMKFKDDEITDTQCAIHFANFSDHGELDESGGAGGTSTEFEAKPTRYEGLAVFLADEILIIASTLNPDLVKRLSPHAAAPSGTSGSVLTSAFAVDLFAKGELHTAADPPSGSGYYVLEQPDGSYTLAVQQAEREAAEAAAAAAAEAAATEAAAAAGGAAATGGGEVLGTAGAAALGGGPAGLLVWVGAGTLAAGGYGIYRLVKHFNPGPGVSSNAAPSHDVFAGFKLTLESDAELRCPFVCGQDGARWTGNWAGSSCGCGQPSVPIPSLSTGLSRVSFDVGAGNYLHSLQDAQTRCDSTCSEEDAAWTGAWALTSCSCIRY